MFEKKKTSVGFLNVQKPFNFLWIIIVFDYFLSYSLHHDMIKELIAYIYGSFTLLVRIEMYIRMLLRNFSCS